MSPPSRLSVLILPLVLFVESYQLDLGGGTAETQKLEEVGQPHPAQSMSEKGKARTQHSLPAAAASTRVWPHLPANSVPPPILASHTHVATALRKRSQLCQAAHLCVFFRETS